MLALHLLYLIPLTFYIWAWLHERAHVYVADRLIGVVHYHISLRPRRYKGGIRWAEVSYYLWRTPTEREKLWIALAPRVPSAVGVLLAPAGSWLAVQGLLGPYLLLAWTVLLGGGVVDLITHSIGSHDRSDLQRAARYSGLSPWLYRIVGMSVAALSIGVWAWGLVVHLYH